MTSKNKHAAVVTLVLLTTFLLPSIAEAQDERTSQKYLFGAVGTWRGVDSPQMGGGFGYERIFRSGLGVGLEGEGFWGSGYGGGIGSANASYHFQRLTSSREIVPFGTFGVSAVGACGGSCLGFSGFNFGGGSTFWFTPDRGLRLEFRDHVLYNGGDSSQKMEMRFGFSF
jgi:hypothetical protein